MHSQAADARGRVPRLTYLAGICLLMAAPDSVPAAANIAPATNIEAQASVGHSPDSAQIASAVERLRDDPNLATSRQSRTLHWVNDRQSEPPRSAPGWIWWVRDLFAWLAESSRLLLWAVALLMIALLVVYLLRGLSLHRKRRDPGHDSAQSAPGHVHGLDIRPESLPDDVGAAALALWDAGEWRAALSLLYRGLLSRLANDYSLPIQRSSTEGDCLQLATRLDAAKSGYVARLVKTWQRAVYGAVPPAADDVRKLCAEFATVLIANSRSASPQPA